MTRRALKAVFAGVALMIVTYSIWYSMAVMSGYNHQGLILVVSVLAGVAGFCLYLINTP